MARKKNTQGRFISEADLSDIFNLATDVLVGEGNIDSYKGNLASRVLTIVKDSPQVLLTRDVEVVA